MSEARPPDLAAAVLRHYEPGPLTERLLAAIDAAGVRSVPSPADLAPWDQFHLGGLHATDELAQALAPDAGERVLDLGSGLGGPARLLASRCGCEVTGIDLSDVFVAAARALTDRCGLEQMVRFVCGDVTALPLPSESFDHAWTLHVAMNVADRVGFYREAHRVLRPGGRLVVYDVVAGNGKPLTFPVPWSSEPATSHLTTAEQTRQLLARAGFEEQSFADRTAALRAQLATGPAASGLTVVMGPRFSTMTRNLAANLHSGRVGVIRLVLTRPGA